MTFFSSWGDSGFLNWPTSANSDHGFTFSRCCESHSRATGLRNENDIRFFWKKLQSNLLQNQAISCTEFFSEQITFRRLKVYYQPYSNVEKFDFQSKIKLLYQWVFTGRKGLFYRLFYYLLKLYRIDYLIIKPYVHSFCTLLDKSVFPGWIKLCTSVIELINEIKSSRTLTANSRLDFSVLSENPLWEIPGLKVNTLVKAER